MGKQLNDVVFENQRLVGECTRHMSRLAEAAKLLGQDGLAKDLYSMAGELDDSAEAVRSAYSIDLHESVRRSEQSTKNMMGAALLSCVGADNKTIEKTLKRPVS